MAKFTGPKGKIVRRFGVNLYGNPKFDQLLQRRNQKPGQHGSAQGHRRISEYALQLTEKQKLRHSYCLLEKQFRKIFKKAEQQKGVTGDNLLSLLERRLDTLLFRSGFGCTMMQARQLINHGHIKVNDRCVDIASFMVKTGDRISVRDSEKSRVLIARLLNDNLRFIGAQWFSVDKSTLTVVVNHLPQRNEIESFADENMVIEFYSK
ncbi:small subunit ribosomal protein S4 [Desulfuromusa kysingii]|uniref:Small ribosomal subunit protein uS4 n=1 Tax=Desulfuromusa kysingii TaxID=37625 RepID=A0A1H4BN71_9BACT|nr:30S ribosomal protein S4 [Desulfuromusa kysingii]SEA49579.1 small subunit ribosomal protein S4 [Desulfuromusa kysingii]